MRSVHVVVQTHWDREWYLPRVTTQARAQAVLQRVCTMLDDGLLPGFLFDGQTVAFADLLAVAEAPLHDALLRHARSGRLVIGPWYVMADEFLVSGESLLRNLEIGHADAARQGAVQSVGYLPDSFGHAAMMPAILRQFDIDCAVLWRGADAAYNTFDWVAPSGDRVGTVFLPEGYYQHPLNLPAGLQALAELLQRIAARTPQGPLLLTQGGDHLAPAAELPLRLRHFNATQDAWHLELTTLAAHVRQALAANPVRERIEGELRRNRSAFVLPDVLSTRRYIKRLHQQAEDRLLGAVEPMLARLWPPDRPLPQRALERCWRTLVEQQAHDSICGCSIDPVHAEMEQRFVELGQELDALQAATLQACGATTAWQHGGGEAFADDQRFTLFNPLPLARGGLWTAELFLCGQEPQGIELHDAQARVLPCEVISCHPHAELISPLDDFPQRIAGHRYRVALQAQLSGLGALHLQVRRAATPAPRYERRRIENAAWTVALDEQCRLVLVDRLNGRRGALAMCSELDAGDSYNFSPPATPRATFTDRWRLRGGWQGALLQELHLTIELRTPARLHGDRQHADAEAVVNRGELVLQLRGDSPDLHATLDWDNQACDQRTRLLLPLDAADAQATGADSALAWVERPHALARIPDAPSRQEMPPVVMPSLSAIAAGRWAIAHEAMPEFEVQQIEGRRFVGLTLVRSVGWLSRRDLRTRGVGAGPDLETPDAQCLRRERYRFVLRAPAPGVAARDEALAAARDLRRPPLVLRGHAPVAGAAVDVGNPRVQVSAVRRIEGALELRLWNPTAEAQPLTLPSARWRAVFADGRADRAPVDSLPPHGLLTVRECR